MLLLLTRPLARMAYVPALLAWLAAGWYAWALNGQADTVAACLSLGEERTKLGRVAEREGGTRPGLHFQFVTGLF